MHFYQLHFLPLILILHPHRILMEEYLYSWTFFSTLCNTYTWMLGFAGKQPSVWIDLFLKHLKCEK